MALPDEIAVRLDPVDHTVAAREDVAVAVPAGADVARLFPVRRPILVPNVAIPAQHTAWQAPVDHAVLGRDDLVEDRPAISHFPRTAPAIDAFAQAVVAHPVEVSRGVHRVDD